ncbi:calcium permease [Rhizoctonia solani AG-1 IA]|uniref:Calcium permease n=1 Tax=Thanatephorus cucumeris (strain AG1-IA) TaxID=983506 RepID=L8WXM3_THACA|nr:calcium permease [Rhizoctonia solani AG-1 IA]
MAGPASHDGSDTFETPPSSVAPSVGLRTPLPHSANPASWTDPVQTPRHHLEVSSCGVSQQVAHMTRLQGSSYFPSTSPTPRPVSPNYRRTSTAPRFTRTKSYNPDGRRENIRSASVASSHIGRRTGRDAAFSVSETERDDTDTEEDPGPSRGRTAREPPVDADDELSEPEDPLTVKGRQSMINVEHPFGLRIWKPALYKKSRTVNRNAETDLHSAPSAVAERHLIPGNVIWTLVFGWWLAIIFIVVSGPLWLLPRGGRQYGSLVFGLGWYIFWPFGKYVEGDLDEEERAQFEEELAEAEGLNQSHVHQDHRVSTTETIRPNRERSTSNANGHEQTASWVPPSEHTPLLNSTEPSTVSPPPLLPAKSYGAVPSDLADPLHSPDAIRRHWLGQYIYWLVFGLVIFPLLGFVTIICYGLVFTIPMAKLNGALLRNMWRHPLKIRFCAAPPGVVVPTPPNASDSEQDEEASTPNANGGPPMSYVIKKTRLQPGQAVLTSGRARPYGGRSTVLMCTYRALGLKYYKYTIGGVNILFINLIPIVFFVIFDAMVLERLADHKRERGEPVHWILNALTQRAFIFTMSLASVIPLSYFIGMAVASISAQSSIGMGAVINATFGSIIEIILYGIALTDGKGRLVEGSIVGSLLAGVLLMPGASMCSGAMRHKEQRFNAKSAGVTSTMLIMAIIGVVCPTLFYQTYVCDGCPTTLPGETLPTDAPWACNHCRYEHPDPTSDPFYQSTVKSLMYFCAAVLLFSYLIGLWFSLHTHATSIWQNPQQLMQPSEMPLSTGSLRSGTTARPGILPTHQRTLNRKISEATMTGILLGGASAPAQPGNAGGPDSSPNLSKRAALAPPPGQAAHLPPGAMTPVMESVQHTMNNNQQLQPTQFTADDFTRAVAVATVSALRHQQAGHRRVVESTVHEHAEGGHGGHDAPSWSRGVSASVLLACTALYAIIAGKHSPSLDVILEGSGIDEKFLGITLFALVPNTTEFMNAMSFALTGNIALSMEIGSAYALQVCLLQIPAMVAFSAWWDPQKMGTSADTFTYVAIDESDNQH